MIVSPALPKVVLANSTQPPTLGPCRLCIRAGNAGIAGVVTAGVKSEPNTERFVSTA